MRVLDVETAGSGRARQASLGTSLGKCQASRTSGRGGRGRVGRQERRRRTRQTRNRAAIITLAYSVLNRDRDLPERLAQPPRCAARYAPGGAAAYPRLSLLAPRHR